MPRSTCHHGWASSPVDVTEPLLKFPSVLPSTALLATPEKSTDDWDVDLPNATLTSPDGHVVGVLIAVNVRVGVSVVAGVRVLVRVKVGVRVKVRVEVTVGVEVMVGV